MRTERVGAPFRVLDEMKELGASRVRSSEVEGDQEEGLGRTQFCLSSNPRRKGRCPELDVLEGIFPSTNVGGFSYQYNGRVCPLFQKTVLPVRFGTWTCGHLPGTQTGHVEPSSTPMGRSRRHACISGRKRRRGALPDIPRSPVLALRRNAAAPLYVDFGNLSVSLCFSSKKA